MTAQAGFPGRAHDTALTQQRGDHSPGPISADGHASTLLDRLCGERDAAGRDALLARAVWSRLAEPGDAVAGAVTALLGPVQSLTALVGPQPARTLASALRAAGAESASAGSRQLRAAITRWGLRLDRALTMRDLETAATAGMTLLTPECAGWPAQLLDLGDHAPHALWVRGNSRPLASPALAVVGARACTGYGSHATAELTGEACAAGFTIVSGAAYGVDAVAHRTALAAEAPTVAILAGGADRPYPASHDQLLTRVAEQGAVCSELVPGSAPTRWRFLQRNRIIAALSRAVLVTEAGVRSGTLNTAGHGAEMGRPIGAVPGPITSAASVGCHRLVREYGATLVTNGAELLELLGVQPLDLLGDDRRGDGGAPLGDGADDAVRADGADGGTGTAGGGAPHADTAPGDDGERQPPLHIRVLDALPLSGTRSTPEVATRAGLAPAEAAGGLAELELLGYVTRRTTPHTGEPVWALRKRDAR